MKAAITGASGLVGGNLAEVLLAAGHVVRATRRASTKTPHLEDLAIEWVPGDLGDAASLTEAFRGVDVVFHAAALVGVEGKVTPELTRANVDGVRNVVAAVKASGAGRLVHVSSVAAVGLSVDGQPCTEESPWNFDRYGMADGYAITKRQGEEVVREAAAAGLDAVIANPTFMFGPRDAKPSSGQLIVDVVNRKVPALTPGKNDFVDVRDVARGLVRLAEKGRAGQRYILGGYDMSYAQIIVRIASLAGVRPPSWHAPFAAAALLGWWGDMVSALGGRSLLTSTAIRYAYTERFAFSSDKARRELGYTSGPLDAAITGALAWFRAHGVLGEAAA